MRRIFFSILFFVLAASVQASVKDDIKADMAAGRWAAADTKLSKVVKTHPNDALGHYWMAQVKEREGQLGAAREHLATAKQLAPDLSFASSRDVVAEFERRLGASTEKKPSPANLPSHPVLPVKAEPPPESGHGFLFWLALLGMPLALVGFLLSRSGKKGRIEQERARLHSDLKDLSHELRDAEKAIDGRAELNAEQKMALADRLSQAQGDLARESAALAKRTEFAATRLLIVRLRDIAAEARGEEKPSVRAERQMSDNQQYAPVNPAAPAGGGLGSGVVAGLGGLAAGVALGSLMSGSSHAANNPARGDVATGNDPLAAPDALTSVDFGNDSSSASDWSDSSSDTGGDSGGGGSDW